MDLFEDKIEYIAEQVIKKIGDRYKEDNTILVEASGRHVHLSRESVDVLFGKGYELTKARDLSQPGQYLCNEKVTLIGPKGVLHKVSVLGPIRDKTQIELSKSDGVILGTKVPVRMSGDVKDSAPIVIGTEKAVVKLEEGAIAAKRHIHATLEDANRLNIKDGDIVGIEILGDRGLIFNNVVVRVSDRFSTCIHIDYDEANACGFRKGTRAKIVK